MTPGQRIKELRVENNLGQETLADELGYKTYTTISKWEANKSLPPGKELKKLAEFFEVSVDYILGLDDYMNKNDMVAISDTVELIFFESINQGLIAKDPTQTMEVPRFSITEADAHYFVLKIRTDSMNRLIPRGHNVIILDFSEADDKTLETGDIIIFKMDGEYKIEQFRKTDSMIYLEPSSFVEGFETIALTTEEFDEMEVVGRVVISFRSFA